MFQEDRARSLYQGSGAPVPPILEPPTCAHAVGHTHSNQTLHGDQTRWEENIHRLTTPPALIKHFVPQMLTCYLFTVANIPAFWRAILIWELFRLSSRLLILCRNGCTYRQSFFSRSRGSIILVCSAQTALLTRMTIGAEFLWLNFSHTVWQRRMLLLIRDLFVVANLLYSVTYNVTDDYR